MRPDEQEPDMRRERGTSQPPMAKSKSIKDAGRRSGGCAWKAVELTSGDLQASVPKTGLGKSQGDPIELQKSAAGIVGRDPEGPNSGRDVGVNLKDEMRQKIQTDWPVRRSERVKPGPLSIRVRILLGEKRIGRPGRDENLRVSAPPLNRRVRTRMHGGVGGGGP